VLVTSGLGVASKNRTPCETISTSWERSALTTWIPTLQATALCLSLLWLLAALATRPRAPLAVVWAVFCASIAMFMARGMVGPDAGVLYELLGVGACLTCNGFWLVSRALFRPGPPFAARHLVFAGVVAVLIVIVQQRATLSPALAVTATELLDLLSSTALAMAFWEGMRGWHQGAERRMRLAFLFTYGGCVAMCLVLPVLLDPAGTGRVHAICAAVASAAILLVMQGLVMWRLRHPLAPPFEIEERILVLDDRSLGEALLRTEDIALAALLEEHMRSQRAYLQPELKLGYLAHALQVSEYRISRAIRGPLRCRNISQYVNAYRLDYARELLLDPSRDEWSTLVIGMESGFGSLGAFQRAFKAVERCTPGEFRATRQQLSSTLA
jgi:AraC-like DNA-binding protein